VARSPARDRHPHGSAAAGAPFLPEPGGNLCHQRHGHGAPAGSDAFQRRMCAWQSTSPPTSATRTTSRPWGLPRERTHGRLRPLQQQQGCAELVTAAYRSSFFNPAKTTPGMVGLATARAGNVIGGGDWAKDRLIPDVIQAFIEHRPAVIRNPHAIPPLAARAGAAWRLPAAGRTPVHAGPELCRSLELRPQRRRCQNCRWIVEQISALWGQDAAWQVDAGEHPHEAVYLKLDISKARSRLNWHPALNLKQALQLIVDWSQARSSGADMQQFHALPNPVLPGTDGRISKAKLWKTAKPRRCERKSRYSLTNTPPSPWRHSRFCQEPQWSLRQVRSSVR
jgi:hypothetical protein